MLNILAKEDGPIKADYDNAMMKSVKLSNRRYKVALEENKQKQTGRKQNEKEEKELRKKLMKQQLQSKEYFSLAQLKKKL